ncbi:MAG TPA: hypothetical protein VFD46_07080 [Chryseolinea sp.]|nr:hypothetical protein [Chryseolinea sp.]
MTEKKAKHTPVISIRPASNPNALWGFVNIDEMTVAYSGKEEKEKWELIVAAVNHHDKLVEALRKSIKILEPSGLYQKTVMEFRDLLTSIENDH